MRNLSADGIVRNKIHFFFLLCLLHALFDFISYLVEALNAFCGLTKKLNRTCVINFNQIFGTSNNNSLSLCLAYQPIYLCVPFFPVYHQLSFFLKHTLMAQF